MSDKVVLKQFAYFIKRNEAMKRPDYDYAFVLIDDAWMDAYREKEGRA